MKKLITAVLIAFVLFAGVCTCQNKAKSSKAKETSLQDSINILNEKLLYSAKANQELFAMYQHVSDSFMILADSVDKLNKKHIMSEKQFIQLYKYGRIEKYYNICKNNPSQWKFFKGWINRVLEE